MQFGVILPNFSRLGTRDAQVEIAREAEGLGYNSIWTTDHVMMQKGFEEPYGSILEAMTTLAYLAPLTERVKLGTSVVVLPQREPVLVAKQAATLDYLSGGRLILGVGAGWNEQEFGFLGASFHDRGQRLDESIRAMRELWTSPDPRWDGPSIRFSDVLFGPRPAQPSGPPIWIGGGSRAALRRAATLADGWHAVGIPAATFAEGMRTIRELANGRQVEGSLRIRTVVGRALGEHRAAAGQPQATLSGAPDDLVKGIEEYRAAGAGHLVLHFGDNERDSFLEDMRRFAREVRPSFAGA